MTKEKKSKKLLTESPRESVNWAIRHEFTGKESYDPINLVPSKKVQSLATMVGTIIITMALGESISETGLIVIL